jgi:hypothetical protein
MKKKIMISVFFLYAMGMGVSLIACTKKSASSSTTPPIVDTGLVNTNHLDNLYTPVTFADGTIAAGVYIYSNYPGYINVEATGEGFTCVDDVSRAALVYLRSSKFSSDTSVQSKVYNLITFILEMQSPNGYFYNFLFANNLINTSGATSVNNPNWWSWRALQTLTEAAQILQNKNVQLYNKVQQAINKLIAQIKIDLVNLPETTTIINGITIPQWLPAGSGTDQSSTLILGLINYCTTTNDAVISTYIKELADGIVLMQQGDTTHFPYRAFLSWENTWHAYGNLQAYALMQVGSFLNTPQYITNATAEVDNFYPWLLQNGFQVSFSIDSNAGAIQILSDTNYAQIAYGIEPMVFAAAEAFNRTGQQKYADMAGHLAAWFLGANAASVNMYSLTTGICYDGISSPGSVNLNSGAESTIEALLTLEIVEKYPAIKTAMNKYKKN